MVHCIKPSILSPTYLHYHVFIPSKCISNVSRTTASRNKTSKTNHPCFNVYLRCFLYHRWSLWIFDVSFKNLGNILNNYEPTITITILRIAVSVMASVGFPLQLHPCIPSLYAIILRMKLSARRIYLAFDHRIQLSVSSPTRSTISRLEDVDDELLSPTASRKVQTSQIDDSRDDDSMSEQEHRYTAIFGLFLSLSLAIAFVRLDEIYSVVGSLSGSLICLIFPAFFALRCLKMEKKDVLCSLLVAGSGSFIAITSLLSPYL